VAPFFFSPLPFQLPSPTPRSGNFPVFARPFPAFALLRIPLSPKKLFFLFVRACLRASNFSPPTLVARLRPCPRSCTRQLARHPFPRPRSRNLHDHRFFFERDAIALLRHPPGIIPRTPASSRQHTFPRKTCRPLPFNPPASPLSEYSLVRTPPIGDEAPRPPFPCAG